MTPNLGSKVMRMSFFGWAIRALFLVLLAGAQPLAQKYEVESTPLVTGPKRPKGLQGLVSLV